MCIYIYICWCVSVYVCMCVCVYVCTRVRVCFNKIYSKQIYNIQTYTTLMYIIKQIH